MPNAKLWLHPVQQLSSVHPHQQLLPHCPASVCSTQVPWSQDALLHLLCTDKPLRTGMPAHRHELACRLTVQQVPAARKSLSDSMHC